VANNPVLLTLYAIAALVVGLVGFGIESFYPTPQAAQGAAPSLEAPFLPPPPDESPPQKFTTHCGAFCPGGIPGAAEAREQHNRVASVGAVVAAVWILAVCLIPCFSQPVVGEG